MPPSSPKPSRTRATNPRGSGQQLREDIVAAAARLLDDLGEDEGLSLRAVAREVGVAATSVYLHFADRDALVVAVMESSFADMMRSAEEAENAARDPVDKLRARLLAHARWAQDHYGLFKVLHESTLHSRRDLTFLRGVGARTTEAVRRCIEAGVAPAGDPAQIALDLRVAVHGMVSIRINQPHVEWPPMAEQLERFLVKLVGIPPTPKRSRRSGS